MCYAWLLTRVLDIVQSLQLAEKIFEWVDTINVVLIDRPPGSLEYRETMVLIEGQRLLLAALCRMPENRSMLIGLVEIQLINLISHLESFASSRAAFREETYGTQLMKIAVLETMGAFFEALDRLGFHEVGFWTRAHVLQVFECAVERPKAGQMTPVQFEAWADLQVSFVVAKWQLVGTMAAFFAGTAVVDVPETFERCLVALETSKYLAVPAILQCLTRLTPLLGAALPTELLGEAYATGQAILATHYDSPKWFDVYAAAYIDFAFQPALLGRTADASLHGPDGLVRAALAHCLDEVCPRRKGLINKVSSRLHETWARDKASRDAYAPEIGQLLMYGPVRDCPEEAFLAMDEAEQAAAAPRSDYLTRVFMTAVVNGLDAACEQDHLFALQLVRGFLGRSLGVGVSDWDTKKVFPNAIQHRRKMRSWLAMLVLQRMLRAADFAALEADLWTALGDECMASTRLYMEWFLIRCYMAFPEAAAAGLLGRLADRRKPASLSISVMAVTYHVAQQAAGLEQPFYARALQLLLTWSTQNNFSVRQTALWAFRGLHRRCTALFGADGLDAVIALQAESFVDPEPQLAKAMLKLDGAPNLGGYDPEADYNLGFIYYDMPRMLGMAPDELITHYSFRNVATDGRVGVPIGGTRAAPAAPPAAPAAVAELAPARTAEESATLFKDFQRKLAIWDLSLLEEELGTFRRNRELEKRKALLGECVVVASLVDKVPNLAGLSRTCEIFGATRLVVPDLAVVDDPQFKAICMTSDKWLQIDAVPPATLLDYLSAQRQLGFRILAVEQTSQSFPLQAYTFPERFVLVLGNETMGIPPEILHVVDDCIEIPQNGMIRSLNVHVCGSIVLWESRRQLLLKDPGMMARLNTGTPDIPPCTPSPAVHQL